ncbi:hypothetical protein [Streptomyces sp. NPDC101150]|uniref:hypothetical protein n=1 Tax=Streptomyces sp. NPDC101150 TaxID=3366114 RepID=UPI003809BFAD
MLRLRFEVIGWTRRVLVLTDTPRPDCPDCQGDGGTAHDYGDHNGEYAGTEWEPCPCWDEDRRWLLTPLPRMSLRRRGPDRDPWGPGSYSDEPPF